MGSPSSISLNESEVYAVACALQGKHDKWRGMQLSPWLETMLTNVADGGNSAVKAMQAMLPYQFGDSAVVSIFKADTECDPPTATKPKSGKSVFVPSLPAAARLNDKVLAQAETAGKWVDDVTEWAATVSPMTPRNFLQSGALWLIALATARRCYWHFHKPLHAQFYVIWVADTSRYRKTTGANTLRAIAAEAIPHMLLPEEMTPEAFLMALGGRRPVNYEKLSPRDKTLIDLGIPHAPRRGLMLDEISSLLGAAKHKDHMHGLEELILRGFDAPDLYRRWTQAEGYVAVRDMTMNIIGMTTPAALARNLRPDDWQTGLMARFVTLYPERVLPYKLPLLSEKEFAPPDALVKTLKAVHYKLPAPPSENEMMATDSLPKLQAFSVIASKEAITGFQRYTEAVTYDMLESTQAPDERLTGNYSRLHEYAARIALSMAIVDWSESGEAGVPIINGGHWARGQQIAEEWRASWHYLLDRIDQNADNMNAERVMACLGRFPAGLTKRELGRNLNMGTKILELSLEILTESGEIEVIKNGRKTIYKLTN